MNKQKKQCRFCTNHLEHSFCDLGVSPLSNSFLTESKLKEKEHFFPLHAYVCKACFLVQLEEFQSPEDIFSDYAYFSSFSDTWHQHCKTYSEDMISKFGFNSYSLVIEIASNDGTLLKYFKEKNVPVLGVEPAANVAKVAKEAGIPTLVKFFGVKTAQELVKEGKKADLLLGNNVLAHVPDINDFVEGMNLVLKPDGVLTMEFPHLLKLIQENQFDTIYHEHFSYLSFVAAEAIFAAHDIRLFDVEEIPTHGGSLRIYGCHKNASRATSSRVEKLKKTERSSGLCDISTYENFADSVKQLKKSLLEFLVDLKNNGKTIAGYGAPAKGNTLLNYCGIKSDLLSYTVDRSPHKQGNFLPGSHIPIHHPEMIRKTKPDYVLILPWNIKEEIMSQMSFIKEWGGKFVVPIPHVQVI
jgi:2-polyprenyl-3-methyl-5-hydroxy-6-metoxy-1,4-benzoquinol methylase